MPPFHPRGCVCRRKFCKPKNPWLVRMLLGDKINLVALRRDASQVGVVAEVQVPCVPLSTWWVWKLNRRGCT